MRWSLLLCVLWGAAALAKPPGPATFCAKYPNAPACVGTQPACTYCHTSPPARNAFGTQLEGVMAPGAARPLSDGDFQTALPGALVAVEMMDADGDGVTNRLEIQKGTQPADPRSKPDTGLCGDGSNPQYKVCKYDPPYAYKKVLLDFCGASPDFAAMETFRALTETQQRVEIDAALDGCLKTEFWRGKNGQLWELGHKKVRPVGSLKDGPEERGQIPLADYYDDYNLYAWSQTDGHDARDVLTADFFITRATNPTTYAKAVTIPRQNVTQANRAGNLTTQWFLVYNVMFTALPRNAASQAYRSYLGLDIAKQEGLYPIPNEPKDYDNKGVTQSLCAQCHATLDPLSYPFKNYDGLTAQPFGTYRPMRIEQTFAGEAPNITMMPESGHLLGQKVNNLREWAQVAANSDAFAVATVSDYWKLLNGQAPSSSQNEEFVKLWKRFKAENAYSVDKMLHELVRGEAYGAP